MKNTALYPGSFDPFTRGHEHIVAKAQKDFNVRVGMAINEEKYWLFALQERVRIAQRVLAPLGLDPLAVIRVSGSVARWAHRNNINTVIQWERNKMDEIAKAQLEHFYRLETPHLTVKTYKSEEELQYASSSSAKELVRANHDPSSIISLHVRQAITSRLLSQYPVFITGGMGTGKTTLGKNLEKEARRYGLTTRHIEFDAITHDIYTNLSEPIYIQARARIAEVFGADILDSSGWVQRSILRTKLQKGSGDTEIDQNKLQQLEAIMSPIIDFRYRDMIEGARGIIFLDGIIKEKKNTSRHAHHHTLLVDAAVTDRIERVSKRYETKWDPQTEAYIRSMIAGQPTRAESESILETIIERDNNGSITFVDNSSHGPDVRKTFFRTLNAIDTFGELRAELILKLLGIQGDVKDHIAHLQKNYNHSSRYYHSWEHIIESLTILFDMACEMDLSDEDIAIIGGSILFHDFCYEINMEWYSKNESKSAQEASSYLNRFGVDSRKVGAIIDLILETRHGRVHVPDNPISHISHDIDMAILGSWEVRYRQYARDVRDEFTPMISGKAFENIRRDKFLTPILSNVGWLYKTSYGQEHFAPNLERNLSAERDGKIILHAIDTK